MERVNRPGCLKYRLLHQLRQRLHRNRSKLLMRIQHLRLDLRLDLHLLLFHRRNVTIRLPIAAVLVQTTSAGYRRL